jgi:hypothetical protein
MAGTKHSGHKTSEGGVLFLRRRAETDGLQLIKKKKRPNPGTLDNKKLHLAPPFQAREASLFPVIPIGLSPWDFL